MTFWQWLMEHRTKVLGVFAALVGATAVMTQGMTFDGLLEPTTVRWLGIICALSNTVLGVLTAGAGFSNSAQVRVAEAKAIVATELRTALNTTPPGGGQ